MGAVLGFVAWAAVRYTTIPQQMLHAVIAWSQHAAAQWEERQAATADSGQMGSTQPAVSGQPPAVFPGDPNGVYPMTNAPSAGAFQNGADAANRAPAQFPNQQASYIAQQTAGPSVPANGATRREAIERRLQEMGAVYSLLEMWGSDAPRYRYHCRVAVAGNPQVTRSFEAHGRNPSEAMEQVLRAVETSRVQAGFGESHSW